MANRVWAERVSEMGLISLLLLIGGGVMMYFGFDANLGLWIGGQAVVIAGLVVLVVRGVVRSSRRRKRLLRAGVPGTATVTAFRDTGITTNDNPKVEFTLQVTPSDGTPAFTATTRHTVSRLELPFVGQQFLVRFDAVDRTDLTIAGPA
ncbi:hypothetical protein [Amycolatopsis sp. NBC_01480]|uniref:hypothetical protein n=1 Tax=Amycolatopsis sp. NBC_01480 TaxID=2903562 RepID=UPI002E2A48E5|nr:hypothetical protein [Amycolatopsis sp. NBC_01480]